jgi:hypothetical protein
MVFGTPFFLFDFFAIPTGSCSGVFWYFSLHVLSVYLVRGERESATGIQRDQTEPLTVHFSGERGDPILSSGTFPPVSSSFHLTLL